MVNLVKRRRKGKTEYYLKYSSATRPREKYLGTAKPKNLEKIKKEFEEQAYRKDKTPLLETIRENYDKQSKAVDPKIKSAEIRGFKINHTWSTQRIEGSTMTLKQTRKLLEDRLSTKDTAVEDIVEAEQIDRIFEEMLRTDKDVSKRLILAWHAKLFERTDPNNAGSFRREDVGPYLGKTEYAMWPDVIPEIDNMVSWYKKNKHRMNPVELSARLHLKFELIHPFIDGNGRIGRLLMIFVLHKNGYPMTNIEPKEKQTYINKLESSFLKKDSMIFVKWIISRYLRMNKKFLK